MVWLDEPERSKFISKFKLIWSGNWVYGGQYIDCNVTNLKELVRGNK